MPTYKFINEKNQKVTERYMSLKERDAFLKRNKHYRQLLAEPAIIGDNVRLTGEARESMKAIMGARNPGGRFDLKG